MRRHRGRKPRSEAGWVALAKLPSGWIVFVRDGTPWSSVKAVADGRASGKANYWLGWDGKRFARQADVVELMKRPELYAEVERLLQARGLV